MSQENGPSKFDPRYWNIFNRTTAPVQPTAPTQDTTDTAMDTTDTALAQLAQAAVTGEQPQPTAPVTQTEQTQVMDVEPTPVQPSLFRRMSQRGFDGLNYAKEGTVGFARNNARPIMGGLVTTAGIMTYDYLTQTNPVGATVLAAASALTGAVVVPTAVVGTKVAKSSFNLGKNLFEKAKEKFSKKRTADEAGLTEVTDLQAEVQSGNLSEVAPTQTTQDTDVALANLAQMAVTGGEQASTQQPTVNLDILVEEKAPTFTPVADTVVAEEKAPANKRKKTARNSDVSEAAVEPVVEQVVEVVEEPKKGKKAAAKKQPARRGRSNRK